MRTLLAGLVAAVVVATTFAGAALAAAHAPGTTGQPSQSCQAEPSTPGNAANAPGSAFHPTGNAGTHYAGQPQNSKNPRSVAQYDVACFQVSQR
jgi:hypothetical protein